MNQPLATGTNALLPPPDGLAPGERIWGWGMWGMMAVVLAVPELTGGKGYGWQTISSTVGHLESRFWPVAIVVVGLMIATAFFAIQDQWRRIGTGLSTEATGHLRGIGWPVREPRDRTPGHRYTNRTPTPSPVLATDTDANQYWVGGAVAAVFMVCFASFATAQWWEPANQYRVGYVLYGLVALIWVVFPNAAAYWRAWDVPFPTLFRTLADLERLQRLHRHDRRPRILAILLWPILHVPILAIVVVGLGILLIHIAFYPWPDAVHDLNVLHNYLKIHPSGWPR